MNKTARTWPKNPCLAVWLRLILIFDTALWSNSAFKLAILSGNTTKNPAVSDPQTKRNKPKPIDCVSLDPLAQKCTAQRDCDRRYQQCDQH